MENFNVVKPGGGADDEVDDVKVPAAKGPARLPDYVLRFLAMVLTLTSAILMVTAKETETVQLQLVPTLPPMAIVAVARWSYMSAFVYFVVVNLFAGGYTALSLLLSAIYRGSNAKRLVLVLTVADVIMLGLTFSGNGAAAAVGLIGQNGNSHVGWNKISGVFPRFSGLVKVSLAVSLFGSFMQLALVLLSVVNIHKSSH